MYRKLLIKPDTREPTNKKSATFCSQRTLLCSLGNYNGVLETFSKSNKYILASITYEI